MLNLKRKTTSGRLLIMKEILKTDIILKRARKEKAC